MLTDPEIEPLAAICRNFDRHRATHRRSRYFVAIDTSPVRCTRSRSR